MNLEKIRVNTITKLNIIIHKKIKFNNANKREISKREVYGPKLKLRDNKSGKEEETAATTR